ncbi:MAG TPA: hypothetical protein VHM30_00150 [Gemmatimonadaceae bacterium]|nr:hypothetical protein [Gemmatimonadaceae bacterium]
MYGNAMWWARRAALTAGLLGSATVAAAQTQLPAGICDFDISDNQGAFVSGSTMHLTGRAGASTNRGHFFLINADSAQYDVDNDGFNAPGTACNFNAIYTPIDLRGNLVNVSNPALAIPAANVILVNLPRQLPNGTMARVDAFVEVPRGTVAGTYIGVVQLRDSIYGVRNSPTREVLAADRIFFEVTVTEARSFTIVDPDSAALLDSVVIRGRAGQRASGVFRIANTGNVNLSDVRVTATDLRSESAVGLIIPASNITFSPGSLAGIQYGDTARVVVTVQIPRGILGGRYRGELIVQGQGTAAQRVPLIVIVTSTRGILFGNNPVREINGDIANIAFNGDPGTEWKLAIYDMAGLVTFKTTGTVFAGSPLPGGGSTLVGADYAVNVIWPLRNGRGEAVASGMYLVVVESIVNNKRQLAQDKLMVIR